MTRLQMSKAVRVLESVRLPKIVRYIDMEKKSGTPEGFDEDTKFKVHSHRSKGVDNNTCSPQ